LQGGDHGRLIVVQPCLLTQTRARRLALSRMRRCVVVLCINATTAAADTKGRPSVCTVPAKKRAENAGTGAILTRTVFVGDESLSHDQAVAERRVTTPSHRGSGADLSGAVGSRLAGALRRSAR